MWLMNTVTYDEDRQQKLVRLIMRHESLMSQLILCCLLSIPGCDDRHFYSTLFYLSLRQSGDRMETRSCAFYKPIDI